MALMALALQSAKDNPRKSYFITTIGLLGASLFYGDGIITPAISVLSAVEGLQIIAPSLSHYVLPITITVLSALFIVQAKGTGAVGKMFSPIMCLWFAILGILGVNNIIHAPSVLAAVNPYYAVHLLFELGWHGFLIMGAVVLAITGAEALYADMGHFGLKPIRYAWFGFVFPTLLLNYFGQGALLLEHPEAVKNPFYLLAPTWAMYPLLILATLASVIASQAVISGAFSVTRQAIQLGYCPAHEYFAYVGSRSRTSVYPRSQLDIDGLGICRSIEFRIVLGAGFGLRHCRYRDHDCRYAVGVYRHSRHLAVEKISQYCFFDHFSNGGFFVSFFEQLKNTDRRLVAFSHRRCAVFNDDDLD